MASIAFGGFVDVLISHCLIDSLLSLGQIHRCATWPVLDLCHIDQEEVISGIDNKYGAADTLPTKVEITIIALTG